MKKITILLVAVTLLFSCQRHKAPDALILAGEISEKYTPANSAYMVWNYELKPILSKDTFRTKVGAWIIRDFQDTVLKAQILVKYYKDTTWGIYYKGEGYEYNPKKEVLTRYPAKYARYAVSGSGYRLIKYFLNPQDLIDIIKDTLNKVSVFDTTVNGKKYWALSVRYPDQEDVTNYRMVLLVDPKTKLIKGYTRELYVISDWQREFAYIDTVAFDVVGENYIESFLNRAKSVAEIRDLPIGDEQEEEMKLLQAGTKAPNITGTYYRTGKEFSLYDQDAKVYVIDFWYQSCGPCMRAVPYLVDLYEKYKDKGLLVLGVNSVDNTDQRRPYLKKFIEVKNMVYPVIMVDRAIDQMYKVPGYPTVYVLDSNKKIVGYEVGFDPDKKLDRVEQMVKDVLSGK